MKVNAIFSPEGDIRRYILISVCAFICAVGTVGAQTPVEKLIDKYSSVKGSRDFIASGASMILARSLIRATPLAAIASEVSVLEVLKMQDASPSDLADFKKDLDSALSHYEYYGQTESKNGLVDLYIGGSTGDTINELVIYNPTTYSLNSLKGPLDKATLLSILKKT